MRKHIAVGVLALAAAGVPMAIAAQSKAEPDRAAVRSAPVQAPVKSVVLYSSGVGYFEHEGRVAGCAEVELRFKAAQINDILKSLVVKDGEGERAGTVVYPARDPGRATGFFQVDLGKEPSLAELLGQLRGARVRVTPSKGVPQSGVILGVEKKTRVVDDAVVEGWQINVMTGAGMIRPVSLDDLPQIELEDTAIQEELKGALAAISQSREQEKKPVTVRFEGNGERTVRLAYVVEAPIWKTSYRLVLGEKPTLQGWAIVENQTDHDWNDVRLSLVSGRPISFVQELYSPVYLSRPLVQPELYGTLKSPPADPAVEAKEKAEKAAETAPASAKKPESTRRVFRVNAADEKESRQMLAQNAAVEVYDQPLDPTAAVSALSSPTAKLGELYEYKLGHVSLPRQRSAMISIVNDKIEVERISIYNPTVLPRNPLTGARIRNTTGKPLLQGPITVYREGSYAGDARIDNLAVGQERFIGYGIDLQLQVNSTRNTETSRVAGGRIVKGILQLKRSYLFSQDYIAENKTERDKPLLVEHPLRRGWSLTDSPKPIESTETLHRFKVIVPAGGETVLTVKEEMAQQESVALSRVDAETLELYARSPALSREVRDAVSKAAALRQRMGELERSISQRRQEIAQLSSDQGRLRENIKTMGDQPDLRGRLMQQFEDSEKRIDGAEERLREQEGSLDRARTELEEYVSRLDAGE